MKFLVTFALAIWTIVVAPTVLRATDALCPLQNATLRGTYLSHGTGTLAGGPISAVGTATYDGNGNTSNTFTASVNGTILKGVTVTGTYTVNPDCTGSLDAQNGAHYDFVVSPDGKTVFWIETDPGTVFTGDQVRLKPAAVEDTARAGPHNMGAVQVPPRRAASPESLSTALLAPENSASDRFLHVWLSRLDGLRRETT
jgi:hypothetical protein